MTTFHDAKLAGMMAGMSAKAERHPPAEYGDSSLRDAWLRGFDEMQQSLGTWSPALPPAQQVAPNVTDAKHPARNRKVAKEEAEAEPEPPPPPGKRSMLAILDDSLARQF
jgi:hypothetical protein